VICGENDDKASIRSAIHVGIPRSVEAYLQEPGRIGRDGLPAEAVLLYSPQDLAAARHLDESVSSERRRQMLRYALSRTCRRQFLYRLMEQEVEVCSGCDVCDGTTVVSMEGEDAIIRFIRRNPRRYTPREVVKLLWGGRLDFPAFHRAVRSFPDGDLHTWERSDVEEALESLLVSGSLRIAKRGFWKGKLSPGRKIR
jgi:ATP-dependent DNA helicase RecQ